MVPPAIGGIRTRISSPCVPHSSALVRQRTRAAVTRSDLELRTPDDARQKPIRVGMIRGGSDSLRIVPTRRVGTMRKESDPIWSTPPTDRRGPPRPWPRESRSPNTSGLAPPAAGNGAFSSFVTDRLSNSATATATGPDANRPTWRPSRRWGDLVRSLESEAMPHGIRLGLEPPAMVFLGS